MSTYIENSDIASTNVNIDKNDTKNWNMAVYNVHNALHLKYSRDFAASAH